mgnify:CR=1 FL=1
MISPRGTASVAAPGRSTTRRGCDSEAARAREKTRAEALQSRMDSLRAEAEKTASLLRLAEAEIKRADWGLTWNAAIEGGGVLVSDKIKLEFDISAIKNA